ncbi:Hypothetical_protein [Hexamita inflata]|uniref:Hypothetical_protein n=1 Tax=Hexamita inflata TaxID=28002 RepID=A0AA86R7S2_9EUKA|nr:Hypothetical protein HINF_LOCUS60904 [Hexamita inflata]
MITKDISKITILGFVSHSSEETTTFQIPINLPLHKMKMSISKKFVVPAVLQQVWKSEQQPITRSSSVYIQQERKPMDDSNYAVSLMKVEIELLKTMNKKVDFLNNSLQTISRNINNLEYNQNNILCFMYKQQISCVYSADQ